MTRGLRRPGPGEPWPDAIQVSGPRKESIGSPHPWYFTCSEARPKSKSHVLLALVPGGPSPGREHRSRGGTGALRPRSADESPATDEGTGVVDGLVWAATRLRRRDRALGATHAPRDVCPLKGAAQFRSRLPFRTWCFIVRALLSPARECGRVLPPAAAKLHDSPYCLRARGRTSRASRITS